MSERWQALLEEATRCLLAFDGRRGPLIVPMAHWSDGRELWMTTAADTVKVRRLAADGACTVCVTGHDEAVVSQGSVRIYGLSDPVRLALHAAPISGALAALAFRNAPTLLGYAKDVALVPARWRPHNRVVLRVALDDPRLVRAGDLRPGIAPPLPTVVPADVRRAVGGHRSVVVAHGAGPPAVTLATWGRGLVLTAADGSALEMEGPVAVAVAVDADPGESPVGVRGLVLHGTVRDGSLVVDQATWWRGFELATVDVPRARPSPIVLPD